MPCSAKPDRPINAFQNKIMSDAFPSLLHPLLHREIGIHVSDELLETRPDEFDRIRR